jgi:hypothetical protein
MPGVARIDTERLANLRRTLASIVSGTSQAENKLYDISRETAERRALRDILARYGAETGPRDVVQQMLKPSPYPTSPTGELAQGPPSPPTLESFTTQGYPSPEESRAATARAMSQMLLLRNGPSLAGALSKLLETPDRSVTPFEAYLRARTPEEKQSVMEAWRSTQPPKQPANRIHTGRVQGKDGFWYDVFVDPDTKQAEYLRSDVAAPSPARAGRGPTIRNVGGRTVRIDFDENGAPVLTDIGPATPEKITRTLSFTLGPKRVSTKAYSGDPNKVLADMKARQAAIEKVVKSSVLAAGGTGVLGLGIGKKGTWEDFKSGKANIEDLAEPIRNYAAEYQDLESNIAELQGGQGGSVATGRVRYEVNGSSYDIPEAEVTDFLKDFPDAKRK